VTSQRQDRRMPRSRVAIVEAYEVSARSASHPLIAMPAQLVQRRWPVVLDQPAAEVADALAVQHR
jgi:hypothetical protein